MAGMNTRRILLGGLAARIVIFGLEGITSQWYNEAMQSILETHGR
ncbi:MAG: hypothetical protein OER21_00320 [Gemmatimonadota bacterium]|nr:hypothetical protein [Gemmatimonadota bacterium]